MGIGAAQAKKFADTFALANAAVDGNVGTEFWNPLPEAQAWHFNNSNTSVDSRELMYRESYKRAEAFAAAGDVDGVLTELGQGLHALQDQIAHSGFWGNMIIPIPVELTAGNFYYIRFHPKLKNVTDGADAFKVGDAKYNKAIGATYRVMKDFARLHNTYQLIPGLPQINIDNLMSGLFSIR